MEDLVEDCPIYSNGGNKWGRILISHSSHTSEKSFRKRCLTRNNHPKRKLIFRTNSNIPPKGE
jgi:hypothetical protein